MKNFEAFDKAKEGHIKNMKNMFGVIDLDVVRSREKEIMRECVGGNSCKALADNLDAIIHNAMRGLIGSDLAYTAYLLHLVLDILQDPSGRE